jgi:pimeloyl-ACP methyl ester carboxylesterase
MTNKVIAHDGLSLEVFATELRHETTVVFANALGVASAAVEPLASALFARGMNLVTWNGRGFPGAYDDSFRRYDTVDNAKDLAAVTTRLKLKSFVLAAWCTGVHTALAYTAGAPDRVRSLVLFNSPNFSSKRFSGVTGDAIGKLSEILVNDEKKLDFFYANIFANNTEEAQTRMTGLPSGPLQRVVQAPFTSGKEGLLRYAHLIKNTSKFECTAESCRSITAPALVIGGRRDNMVAYQDSIALAQMLPAGVPKIFEDWDHYTVFSQPEDVAEVVFARWLGDGERGGVDEACASAASR